MTTPLRFLTYAGLEETLHERLGSGAISIEHVSLALTIQNEAIAEYRSKHGRYSEKGVDKVENEIRGRIVALVNNFLSGDVEVNQLAEMVLNERSYVVLAWAIAQKLKAP
jgi:hypothetical protein